MKAAPVRAEERRDGASISGKPMGIQDEYKKLWR
jgi:hypothetical protein